MEDLEAWMRKYINRYRIIFIDNLETEIFAQGFPRISRHLRSRITNLYRHDSYVLANGELLDCIMKMDDFPNLFIAFCQVRDCNNELADIMKAGCMEYSGLLENLPGSQVRQNGDPRQINEHQQVSFHPTSHASERYHGSRGNKAAGASFLEPPRNSDSVSDTASNVNHDIAGAVDHIDKLLIEQLENEILVCEAQESEGANENSENLNGENSNGENKAVVENKCIVTGVVFRNVGSKHSLSNDVQQAPCPCPYHSIVSREEKNLPCEYEGQVSNSVSDMQNIQRNGNVVHNDGMRCTQNIQRNDNVGNNDSVGGTQNIHRNGNVVHNDGVGGTQNIHRNGNVVHNDELATENILPVFDASNMDRNDPAKMTYDVTKMMINGENITTPIMNIANDIIHKQNDNNDITDSEKNEKLMSSRCENNENFAETAEDKGKPPFKNQRLEQNQECINFASQSEAETSGSYYLTSSDEEELSPTQNHTHKITKAHFEIENLKLPCSQSGCLEESVQELDEREITFDFPQDTIPKEIESPKCTRTSESNFIMLNTGLSGTQCEEDIKKSKYGNTEKKEFDALIDQNRIPTVPTLRESPVSVNLSNDDSLEIKNNTDNNSKPINAATVEGVTKDEEYMEYCNCPTFSLESQGFKVHGDHSRNYEKVVSDPHESNEDDLSLGHNSDSTASFESSEIKHPDFPCTEVMNDECDITLSKQNKENNSTDRESNSDAQAQINTVDQTIAEDNLAPTINSNITSNHNVELTEERTVSNDVIIVNHYNAVSINETTSNARSYIFENVYTPMRNVIHSFFPELWIRF